VTEPSHAVFLSYASQDAEAAQRICEAFRAAGIEVWFDQSELRGGDAWDQSIRRQIKTCALFIPVVSRHTHDRAEGYFRLEWKLAVDRSHLIMTNKAFLLPVVVDDTRDDDENVPDKFRDVQWTRLPAGETPPAFVERVQRLLSGETSTANGAHGASGAVARIAGRAPASGWSRRALPVAAVLVAFAAVAYLAIERPWTSKPATAPATAGPAPVAFAPPPHSVAVLPFVNMSGDKEQEYFSDGLTEELLNSLAEIHGLQVAARTSSFSFQGEHPDIATVAHKLNVASVLEGSVRRSGNTVRITAQLINAVTGFHLWSKSYDRDLRDVLKLQTEIATAVAGALKVTLLGDEAAKIELGGTRSPQALTSYLRGKRDLDVARDAKGFATAMADFDEALRLDPGYARAYAGRSFAWSLMAQTTGSAEQRPTLLAKSQVDARQAISVAPELADGYGALGLYNESMLNPVAALAGYTRATELAPGAANPLAAFGGLSVSLGRTEQGLAALRRAAVLDPLNARSAELLGTALMVARRYPEALQALDVAQSLDAPNVRGFRGILQYLMGNDDGARASCQVEPPDIEILECQALVYHRLGRLAEAQAALQRIKTEYQDAGASGYAEIYAQWGDKPEALAWLEKALQRRDPGLIDLRVEPLLDPLRAEPRFQAIERALKFPSN
jgi:TolB-like protein/tetratricopeptide (TPR) repeat protein